MGLKLPKSTLNSPLLVDTFCVGYRSGSLRWRCDTVGVEFDEEIHIVGMAGKTEGPFIAAPFFVFVELLLTVGQVVFIQEELGPWLVVCGHITGPRAK